MRFSLAVFLFVEYSIVKCQVADFAFSFLPQNDQFLANVLTVADYQNYKTNDNDISQKLSQDNVSHLDINIADFSLNVSNPSNIHRRTGFHSVVITIVATNWSPSVSSKFYALITKTFPTSRGDDLYIFLTENEPSARTLFQDGVLLKLKNKVAIYPTEKNTFASLTQCVYCWEDGRQGAIRKLSSSPSYLQFEDGMNLKGHKLRTHAPTHYAPIYQIAKYNSTAYKHDRGFMVAFFEAVRYRLNFTYDLKPCGFGTSMEGGTGHLLPNGTWAGCVGDLVYDRSDFVIFTGPEHQRIKLAEFSHGFAYNRITFITRKPRKVNSWKSIYRPFKAELWIVLSFVVFLTLGCLLILGGVRGRFVKGSGAGLLRMGDAFMALLGPLLMQVPFKSNPSTPNLVYIFWLFFSVIVGTAYNAKLVSFIASPDSELIPNSFQELSDAEGFRWGASKDMRGGLLEVVFKQQTTPMMSKIYKNMETDQSDTECALRTVRELYACNQIELWAKFQFQTVLLDKKGHHPFRLADDSAFQAIAVFALQKGEIFKNYVNSIALWAFNTGLVSKWVELDWTEVKMKREKKFEWNLGDDGPVPFKLDNFKGAWSLLGIGLLVGWLALGLEKFWKLVAFPCRRSEVKFVFENEKAGMSKAYYGSN